VKDVRQLRYFLGIEVACEAKEIVLSQRKYGLNLLKETSILGCKPAVTPIDQKTRLDAETGAGRLREVPEVGRLSDLSESHLFRHLIYG
jgi:hypothetical protein